MRRCPLSYELLRGEERYSRTGLRRMHPALRTLHVLPWTGEGLRREAAQRMAKMSIQGVQPKVSLKLHVSAGQFDIVDRGGRFILKPAVTEWPHVPENEDVTMRMAAACGVDIPDHGLVYTADEEFAYVIRRVDRTGRSGRLPLEDFAQLTERKRHTKYDSSTEQIIAALDKYATFPAVERPKLFRRLVFCFLTGNEDAHLKNWSLLTRNGVTGLSPAYDLLNSWLVLRHPRDELALPLRGKKANLKATDLMDYLALERLSLPIDIRDAIMQEMERALPVWENLLDICFLPDEHKERYSELLRDRARRLGLE